MDAAHCDGNKHGSLQDIFYAVNRAQYFEFPHANCDVYTNEDLAALYFKHSGYGSYCCGVIASLTGVVCDLSALALNSKFVNHIAAWMRLKFVAEQVDPVRYKRYFERGLIPVHKTPKLPAELLELYKADSTEFYALVDSLANAIQMQSLEMMMEQNNAGLDDASCVWINSTLPTIRSQLSSSCTGTVDPYELPIKLFLEYQRGLRRVFLCLDK